MFFIRRKRGIYGPSDRHNWALVQVDLNETDPVAARDFAIYRVKWYDANTQDSKTKPVVECRFWPKLQELDDDGSFVRYLQMKPSKVSYSSICIPKELTGAKLTLHWEKTVSSAHLISRQPATLTARINKVAKIPNCVDDCYWKELERVANRRDVDVSDIRTVPTTSKRAANTGNTTIHHP